MGVKSLWSLLTPVGRPVMLETMEGKVMAIDSSIWIYQFQATMRDKDGKALTNAHVLGFLRRISKLLFYGIKPVFVFDGGAPVLKRSTLNERRKKKSGAAVSHAKLAEKLLAAQLRREAINQATKGKKKAPDPTDLEDPHTVYLEDIDPRAPKTPSRPKPPPPSSSTTKKAKFHDHDPYKLPEVDIDHVVGKLTQSSAPDPRLATEEELRAFIEEMKPEDFDINSPSFRELPTEVKYEIIGDLRIKSRQTSFARLQKMLKNSRSPLDFSKQQIQNLKQRNALTQQLLVTTDTIGSANISIPVRIASERNREYVLIKNNDGSGGWILGVKDTTGNTYEEPIEIDHEEEHEEDDDDSDADMEEVQIAPANTTADPDLKDYQRQNALSALSRRNTDKGLESISRRPINRKRKENPLFEMNDSDLSEDERLQLAVAEEDDQDEDNAALAFAIQASLDQKSKSKAANSSAPVASSSRVTLDSGPKTPKRQSKALPASPSAALDDDFDDMYATPSRLSTALRFAHSHHDSEQSARKVLDESPSGMFGMNALLTSNKAKPPSAAKEIGNDNMEAVEISIPVEVAKGFEELKPASGKGSTQSKERAVPTAEDAGIAMASSFAPTGLLAPQPIPASSLPPTHSRTIPPPDDIEVDESVGDMEEVHIDTSASVHERLDSAAVAQPIVVDDSDTDMEEVAVEALAISITPSAVLSEPTPTPADSLETPPTIAPKKPPAAPSPEVSPITPPAPSVTPSQFLLAPDSALFIPTNDSRSPSPQPPPPAPYSPPPPPREDDLERDLAALEHEHEQGHQDEEFDAADEMDAHAEEGQFAEFLSQVKGRDLHDVRREIDEEITVLNQQKKAALRDAEDVTQQMVNQIMTMLRLFGIPYITAPMEAEAQCAELVTLGLVDGVITDDSDVFLFGAARVFKNMFNQSKTVECFLSSDLERELGLDRDTLIQLAYLLGSDYTDGLQGVGPVVAMELLKEFPGKDGLWKFREWWSKVQSGKDTKESGSKFRTTFKRKFKSLYLPSDWPSTAVRDAYYHPTVDSSDEPFKWGLPDLDGLRHFFGDELHWPHPKTDDLLLPIIQKMNKRTKAGAVNRQGVLNDWMGLSVAAGSGTMAPRQRQAYASKRLQEVVKDFRKRRAGEASRSREGSVGQVEDGSEAEEEEPVKKKRKAPGGATKAKAKPRARTAVTKDGEEGSVKTTKRKAPAKRAVAKGNPKGKKAGVSEDEESDVSEFDENGDGTIDVEVPLKVELRPRPKPRPKPVKRSTGERQEGEGDEEPGH